MDLSNLNIFSELARSGKTTSFSYETFDRQTDGNPRTASTSFVWLPFSAITINFTYHPLYELFFHRSYLKTTTINMAHTQTTRLNHITLRAGKKCGTSCWGWSPGHSVRKISYRAQRQITKIRTNNNNKDIQRLKYNRTTTGADFIGHRS